MAYYTIERVMNVWDDESGDHVYVGPDADGLDLAELRYVDSTGKIANRITLPREMMVEVAQAILALYGDKAC
jgi:hypothetical protein